MVAIKPYYIFLFFPLFLLTACGGTKKEDKKNDPANAAKKGPSKVDGYIVKAESIAQDIEVPGSLVPYEETEIHPEVSGKVTGIYFKEGTTVSAGSALIKLYDGDLQAQLKKLQVQLSIAKQTENRQQELLKISGISQQDYDLSLLQVHNLEADINILQTAIAKTSIRAHYSGKLGLRNISMGAYVSPSTVNTTIRQLNQLKLDFTVPERYSIQMKTGSPVNFTVEGNPTIYSAKVIATENNIAENTRSMHVKALANKTDGQLTAGSFARVTIELGKNDMALMVPTQAIIPQARDKKVITVRAGIAAMETVTTGVRDSSMVEITSGLHVGDTVLISGLLTVKPGSKVLINPIKP